jgi:hypothetical protein
MGQRRPLDNPDEIAQFANLMQPKSLSNRLRAVVCAVLAALLAVYSLGVQVHLHAHTLGKAASDTTKVTPHKHFAVAGLSARSPLHLSEGHRRHTPQGAGYECGRHQLHIYQLTELPPEERRSAPLLTAQAFSAAQALPLTLADFRSPRWARPRTPGRFSSAPAFTLPAAPARCNRLQTWRL